jgi:hypothetical protein
MVKMIPKIFKEEEIMNSIWDPTLSYRAHCSLYLEISPLNFQISPSIHSFGF